MFKFLRSIIQPVAATILVAALVFSALYAFSKRRFIFSKDHYSEESPEPLGYDSVGNFPPLEELSPPSTQEMEYTLELGTCDDKICIKKTLDSLSKKGVEAFYTPFKIDEKVVFRIRRGIFSSRMSAEKAKMVLNTEKRISCKVVEL